MSINVSIKQLNQKQWDPYLKIITTFLDSIKFESQTDTSIDVLASPAYLLDEQLESPGRSMNPERS